MNLLDLSGLLQTEIIDFSTLSILQQVKSLTLPGEPPRIDHYEEVHPPPASLG